MPVTVLITGFGPFPGAPFNPTAALIKTLSRTRTPNHARIAAHVFHTSYASVDREFPALLRRYRPDVLLMFGLAAQATYLRIETCARNILAALPDVDGRVPGLRAIAPGRPAAQRLPTPARRLLAAARAARVKATLSNDAGSYLCNYLCWRAAIAVRTAHGPRIAAFVHVPGGQNPADLTRAGGAMLRVIASA